MSGSLKKSRIEGKLIRHGPSKQFKYSDLETTLCIKASTPYVSAIKRIQRLLDGLSKKQPKVEYVTLKGMSAAIQKTLSVALYFEVEQGYRVQVLTHTVNVLDEFDDGNLDNDTVYRKREVSAVEIHIYRK